MLATIATANHELVDAKHHPPSQPPLTDGFNIILFDAPAGRAGEMGPILANPKKGGAGATPPREGIHNG
jgi:hypothetical protein